MREGRAMNKIAKDMSKVYRNTPTINLIRNKGKKQLALMYARQQWGYFAKKETKRLEYQIAQIDAELACRAAQEPLF